MRKVLATIALAIMLFLAFLLYREHQKREAAEAQLGLDSSRVLSAVFTQQQDLRVATLTGVVLAKSSSEGPVFHPEQLTKAPYSVSYFIDLKRIRADDYRWDPATKTMTIRIGDIVVENPSIDMSKAVVQQNGIWISRDAGIVMQRQAAERLSGAAATKAKSNENMAKVRKMALDALASTVRRPLAAAGFGDVKVQARFIWEGDDRPGQLDRSRDWRDVVGVSH